MRQENRLHKARSRGLRPIKDERQPKRPIPAFLLFVVERRESGDFKNIAFGDTSQLIVKEWKSFSEAEKKVCHATAFMLFNYCVLMRYFGRNTETCKLPI